jgi:hypothetical protein
VNYQAGDLVQWHQHAPGFKSGERVAVIGREGDAVQVETAEGTVKALPVQHADRFELYRETTLPVAEGDVLRVSKNGYTADGKKRRLNNGDLITVKAFTPEGDIIDHRGWHIGKEYGHLAHGVVTSHASQGMDADMVLVAQSAASFRASSAEQFYVSASRGKGEKGLRLYTDDKHALRKAIARCDEARSATEVWQARQDKQAETAREQVGQRRWRQRYLASLKSLRERTVQKVRDAAEQLRKRLRSHEKPQELTNA